MLKMIIIDDERLIRNGLTDYLDWAALDIDIKAVCANGAEGLEAIHTHRPDIVLTDIAMPVMDGVELLKKARGEGFSGQFIFISSYSEFRYAQEAVKYGAFDYLLKPLEASVLEDSIRRCIEGIRTNPNTADSPWDPELARDLLHGSLLGLPRTEEPLWNLIRRSDTPYPQPALAVGIWTEDAVLPASLPGTPVYCALPPRCMAVILPDMSALNALEAMDDSVRWQSQPCSTELHLLLCRVLLSMWLRLPIEETNENTALTPAAWCAELRKQAQKALESSATLAACQRLCRDALEELRRQIERITPSAVKPAERAPVAEPVQAYDLFEQTLQTGLSWLTALGAADSLGPYALKVVAIIESQYGQSLSLGSVAHSMGISKSHLSATFKASMGCTFSDYLFEYRMKMARELLEKGQYKIYEIAEKVGYPDMAQFSKRFKQYYGLSPRDMQRRL